MTKISLLATFIIFLVVGIATGSRPSTTDELHSITYPSSMWHCVAGVAAMIIYSLIMALTWISVIVGIPYSVIYALYMLIDWAIYYMDNTLLQ